MSDWAPFSAVAMFAEDVRDEVSGTVSLIGVMPDTVLVDSFPAMLPRLHLYMRVSYDPYDPPTSVSSGLRVNDQTAILAKDFDDDALRQTVADAVRSGIRIGTIVARFGAVNVQLAEPCQLNATITWNGEEYIVGNLNFRARD